MALDARFTVEQEWTGHTANAADRKWIVRFCREWIGQADSRQDGERFALDWNACRLPDRPWLRHGEPS